MLELIIAALVCGVLALLALVIRDLRRPACHWCGYPLSLRARMAGRCPSCGTALREG